MLPPNASTTMKLLLKSMMYGTWLGVSTMMLLMLRFWLRLASTLEGTERFTHSEIVQPLFTAVVILNVLSGLAFLILFGLYWFVRLASPETRARFLPADLDRAATDASASDIVKLSEALTPTKLYRQGSQMFTTDPSAARSADDPDQKCVVCFTEERNSAFLPCGHGVCCFDCAEKIYKDRDAKCPMCRASIDKVIKIGQGGSDAGSEVQVEAAYGK